MSVDAQKKGLVGDFKNGGRAWPPGGQPEAVRVHDFRDQELGQAIPYGVYDLTHDRGWGGVGIDHDTAPFAARGMRRWWEERGAARFPRARDLAITADGGGSHRQRSRLWKGALQGRADGLGLPLRVRHFPPGTRQWDQGAHRLFCPITPNGRGRPLVRREALVSRIGSTRTRAGPTVRAALETDRDETGIQVTAKELAAVQLTPHELHGDGNDTIKPRKKN